MTLKGIRKRIAGGEVLELEVHGVDTAIYQAFLRSGDRLEPVAEKGGSTQSFRSRFSALQALARAGVDRVDFVHRSAYGEMIGLESPFNDTELRQEVSIGHLRDEVHAP